MQGLAFDHVGLACSDIAAELVQLEVLGYRAEGPPFTDVPQGVRGVFVAGQHPRLELLEPLDDAPGALSTWIRNGTKMYHLAYRSDRFGDAIAQLRAGGAKLLVPPMPAVAFGGRDIAFVMLRNQLLIELIDLPAHDA